MGTAVGFDNLKYLEEQTKFILERAKKFGNKLYLEFGGKLMFDMHAARVLPGYDPEIKMKLLQQLKDKLDIIICIHAGDIERRKIRADFGISYDQATLKLIDDLREWGLEICGVVITRYESHPSVIQFKRVLELHKIPVYVHRTIHGYPNNVDHIVSEDGYGANPFIKTNKPIVVVSGPGPGSGKMATCLSQIYHEYKRGVKAGYAKFETFPIWNLPLKHPINIAYEAATADLGDYNEIDPFHLEFHKETAVNYNRDVAAFPVLKKILIKLMGNGNMYQSPTDMGVNRVGFAITDDIKVQNAAKTEIIRRYFSYHSEYAAGRAPKSTTDRINLILEEVGVSNNGTIVTGTNSPLMHAPSAVILNAIKILAKIPKNIFLLSPNIMESIGDLKESLGRSANVSLNLEETMIALSISAITNPTAKVAMDYLKELKDCEMHLTHIPSPGDEAGLRRLGVRLTSDPVYAGKNLFLF